MVYIFFIIFIESQPKSISFVIDQQITYGNNVRVKHLKDPRPKTENSLQNIIFSIHYTFRCVGHFSFVNSIHTGELLFQFTDEVLKK